MVPILSSEGGSTMTIEAALREKSVDTQPAGWHYHVCEGQFVYTLKGWVELEFEDGSSCRLEAGDSVFIPGGMRHNEIGTSDDLEILEVCLPANMGTVPVDPPAGRAT